MWVIFPIITLRQCLVEFDNFVVKQENFNRYVSNQLKHNAITIEHLSDLMFRIANDVRGLCKHSSMVHTQLEQVSKSQNDLLNEMNNKMNDRAVRVVTRGGKMAQDTLYPRGHPKRIKQDSQRVNNETPISPSKKKKEKE
jgi:hypothetical protein